MAPLTVSGAVRVPGDKSISHRSLILACLAEGESRVAGILDSEDVRSTAGALRSLGARIPELATEMRINGVGLRGLAQPKRALDCGNSGTTTRLLAGVVAGHPFSARFEGDASLSRRPMKRIAEPLTYMGARFEFDSGDGLPMTVHGLDLRSIDWDTKSASAQVKSAILLAGLVSQVEVRVTESSRSRDHTERMLRSVGVDVESDRNQVCLRPARRLAPLDLAVPADPSSAAFFVALASLAEAGELQLEDVCLNPTRVGFMSAIKRMGGDIRVTGRATEGGEETGTLSVHPASLGDIRITAADVPSLIDELPLLACVAAAARVHLEVTGAAELRVKESDRISVVVRNLRAVGATAEELPDGLRVLPGAREFSGTVDPQGDHRIAMAFGILSAVSGNRIEIMNPEVVAVSYPHFWEDLKRVAS
ncbi:MAG TPA: 3-phosphoshikimate 1-carboxyvinyltransferase [Gemmatimonadaceae bacterium]|nr:3-phosphoshikimate 1-carboxyvinyltransferase [Gemmatimonadaceae bacterium]